MRKNANLLRQWRKSNNWTLQDVADELNTMGLNEGTILKQHISRWELGTHIPNNEVLQGLAELTEIPAITLLNNFRATQNKKVS